MRSALVMSELQTQAASPVLDLFARLTTSASTDQRITGTIGPRTSQQSTDAYKILSPTEWFLLYNTRVLWRIIDDGRLYEVPVVWVDVLWP